MSVRDAGSSLAAAAAARLAEFDDRVGDPTRSDRPMVDRLLDAAALCVRRKGFDATSLEEIAAEARVSRTSLYRHFPNREALFTMLLERSAEPFSRWSMEIVTGGGSAAERLEIVVTGAVLEARQADWLRRARNTDLSPTSMALFRAAGRAAAGRTLAPLLRSMADDRSRQAGLGPDDLLDWLMEQIFTLAQDEASDENGIRFKVRYFVTSVIAPEAVVQQSTSNRLDRLERRLDAFADAQSAGSAH